MAILIRTLCGVGMLLLAAAASRAAAETLSLQEQEIKAGLLYNFLKYTQWPSASSAIVVCVYGDDPFGGYLQPIGGRTVNQREIKLHTVHDASDADSCNLLFVTAGKMNRWPELHRFLAGKAILTVSDSQAFAESGGMIAFGQKNDHISVELNPEAVQAAHLQVEDRLLRLVTIVHSASQKEGQ